MEIHTSPKDRLLGQSDEGKLETIIIMNELYWNTVLAGHALNP